MSLRIVQLDCNKETLAKKLHRLIDQVFRLLPAREEGEDWMKPLETIIIEISGLFNLIDDSQVGLTVISKLEGLRQQGAEVAFPLYRRTILECCALLSELEQQTLEE